MNTEVIQPWYRQFWPWFLIAFPMTAVIAGIITIVIAVKTDDGLVKDDYYKAGLAINQTLERNQAAASLQLSANASWDALTKSVELNLSGNVSSTLPRLELTLLHPTRSHLDNRVVLYLVPGTTRYTGKLTDINEGNWHAILEPEDQSWRINGRIDFSKQTSWTLQP